MQNEKKKKKANFKSKANLEKINTLTKRRPTKRHPKKRNEKEKKIYPKKIADSIQLEKQRPEKEKEKKIYLKKIANSIQPEKQRPEWTCVLCGLIQEEDEGNACSFCQTPKPEKEIKLLNTTTTTTTETTTTTTVTTTTKTTSFSKEDSKDNDIHLVLNPAGNSMEYHFVNRSITIGSSGNNVIFAYYENIEDRCVQSNIPIQEYYEVNVKELSKNAVVAVGFSVNTYPPDFLPGWAAHSIGYHSDDGRTYCVHSCEGLAYSTGYKQGDTIGCGVITRKNGQQDFYFIRNGKYLGIAFSTNTLSGKTYACVGTDGECSLEINFGNDPSSPFRYKSYSKQDLPGATLRTPEKSILSYADSDDIRITQSANSDMKKSIKIGAFGDQLLFTSSKGIQDRCVQSNIPIKGYYEVTITDMEKNACVAIGCITAPIKRYNFLPGWKKKSVGYHSDGQKFDGKNEDGTKYGPIYGENDTIGCGFVTTNEYIMFFFTFNGICLGSFQREWSDKGVYACIGANGNCSLEINFGLDVSKQFLYKNIISIHLVSESKPLDSERVSYFQYYNNVRMQMQRYIASFLNRMPHDIIKLCSSYLDVPHIFSLTNYPTFKIFNSTFLNGFGRQVLPNPPPFSVFTVWGQCIKVGVTQEARPMAWTGRRTISTIRNFLGDRTWNDPTSSSVPWDIIVVNGKDCLLDDQSISIANQAKILIRKFRPPKSRGWQKE